MSGHFPDDRTVRISACREYDPTAVSAILREHFAKMGADEAFFAGKNVVIKPNLVSPFSPDKAATTHPVLVEEAARLILLLGGRVTIAESNGGPYSEAAMKLSYRNTGMEKAAENAGAVLNFDPAWQEIAYPAGQYCRNFEIISPIAEADIIVNMGKLKTHSLTTMTGCVKNLFGTVPGLKKFEFHARYPDQKNFQRALVDLCALLCERTPMLNILDAVVGMEGNGPTGGEPRPIGCILSGKNPFAVDTLGAHLLGLDGQVLMLTEGAARGYCPADIGGLTVEGAPGDFVQTGLRLPDARAGGHKFERLPKFLHPRPVIASDRCVGCGKCAESCPVHTIEEIRADRKRRYRIKKENCIRCFCCQELCPKKAVDIHKSWLFRLLGF